MRTKIIIILFFISLISFGQNSYILNLTKSVDSLPTINKQDIIRISQLNKSKTLFYTFSIYCAPCIAHLPYLKEITNKYKLNTYVILIETPGSKASKLAIRYLNKNFPNFKILSIKNEYGKRKNRRYKNFLTAITPSKFNNINDLSKYILLNNKGNVIMLTSYKDSQKYRKEKDSWKNDELMLKEKIIPFLNE